jgi:hypothetical protein
MRITRRAWAQTCCSCVMTTTVRPSRCRSSRSARTSALDPLSRLPVGSSASSTVGPIARARAIATRCCCPPDSWFGRWSARALKPTRSSSRAASCPRRRREYPPYAMGSSTFACAVIRDTRWNAWKTKPILRLRTSARVSSSRADTSCPSSRYVPVVGTSRQPTMFIRVDLPEPDAPMIATYSPASMSRSTPASAGTAPSPAPYTLCTSRSEMADVDRRPSVTSTRQRSNPPGRSPGRPG